MSTYLVAFVIGEYDFIEERDRNGVLIRVYTPLGKTEQGKFALEVSNYKRFFFLLNLLNISSHNTK
jgi:aminopeptidase N